MWFSFFWFPDRNFLCVFFFFQAEDGIRDLTVTGVQTCALPICDATVLYVQGRCFGFQMDRTRAELGVEDWRTLIGTGTDRWQRWVLPAGLPGSIGSYMDRLGLRFGRLDF